MPDIPLIALKVVSTVVYLSSVVLDAGSHEELMKRCDFYKDMVEAQNKVDRWNLKEVVTENV